LRILQFSHEDSCFPEAALLLYLSCIFISCICRLQNQML